MTVTEIWMPVVGYQGSYTVSNIGRVKALDRVVPHPRLGSQRVKGRIMKPASDKDGYYSVQLCKMGKVKVKRVHVLVAEAFIPNPLMKPLVNHKDGRKSNNDVSNLEWSTHQENENHAKDNGLKARGDRNGNVKLTETQAVEIKKRLLAAGSSPKRGLLSSIAKDYGITGEAVALIRDGKSWAWV